MCDLYRCALLILDALPLAVLPILKALLTEEVISKTLKRICIYDKIIAFRDRHNSMGLEW